MDEIKYIFSGGYRCYSPQFLQRYGLRNISGPFDYLFIDIETVFENIHNQFNKFLSDITLVNKNLNKLEIFYSQNAIDQKLHEFLSRRNLVYMRHNYNNHNLLINQNFLENTPNNLYDWDRICLFFHFNIIEKEVFDKIYKRVNIFKKLYELYSKHMCLFHITKITSLNDFNEYKKYILNLKAKFNIACYLIVIICCDNMDDHYEFENDILYIIKRVKDYDYQLTNCTGTDNNVHTLDYTRENNIIRNVFNFNLLSYNQIKNIVK